MAQWSQILARWRESLLGFLYGYRSFGVVIVVSLLSAILCQNPFQKSIPLYKVGEIAKKNVKAPKYIRGLDEELTDKKKAAAAEQVLEVYDFDPQGKEQLLENLRKAFSNPKISALGEKGRTNFESAVKMNLSDAEWKVLKDPVKEAQIKHALEALLAQLQDYWIVDEGSSPQRSEIVVRDLRSGDESIVNRKIYQKKLLTKEDLKEFMKNAKMAKLTPILRDRVIGLAGKLVEPDLVFNQIETKARQDEARTKVESSWSEISEGEMIIREGQRVDRKHAFLMRELRDLQANETDFLTSLEFAGLLAALTYLFYRIGKRNFRKFKLTLKDQMVTGGFFVVSLAFVSGLNHLFYAAKSQSVGGNSLTFLLPVAFAGMTIRLFTSMEITTFFVILFSTALSWMLKDPYMGLVTLCASLAGAARMRHISQRLDVFKAGLNVAIVQAVIVSLGLQMNLTETPGFDSSFGNLLAALLFSLGSGIFCSTLILGVQPLLEYLGYTTDLRLMELSSTNHPLLKEMIIKAPGTYFHSFTVSQLAEKAAEAIHANHLFARVASLYHDIGKVKKPHYFIENIKGDNKHDKLVPTMSALIISNHVKDGIELGYQYKLPQSIIEIIPQHHGTSLISYFFDKAKKQSSPEEPVDEHDFRYPGPKPQTREGAIILLADAVEATAKSLQNKTQDSLRQAVHATIQRFFLDGQLDECEVSLKDLTAIGNAFLQVLQGVYHQRIDYPHLKEAQKDQAELISKIRPTTAAS